MTCHRTHLGIICVQPTFKPGDLPPEAPDDYLGWHEWAEVQHKAGIKTVECGLCGRWKTPQELSEKIHAWDAKDRRGRVVTLRAPVCTKCADKEALIDAMKSQGERE